MIPRILPLANCLHDEITSGLARSRNLRQILAAAKLPKATTSKRSNIGRRFGWIVVFEVVGIVLIGGICFNAGLLSWLVPVDLIIVGIHFIPLARLFGVPRYTLLGAAFCAIPVLTLILVPADAHVGAVVARYLISSLGCTAASWLTAAASAFEIRRLLLEAG